MTLSNLRDLVAFGEGLDLVSRTRSYVALSSYLERGISPATGLEALTGPS